MLSCRYTINNRAKRRITSSELIISVLHLSDVSGITIERVRYGQRQKESVSALRIPDVSGIPTGRVRYCRNQNTNWIATESLIHIFSYILNLLKSLWFTKSKWIVSISFTQIYLWQIIWLWFKIEN